MKSFLTFVLLPVAALSLGFSIGYFSRLEKPCEKEEFIFMRLFDLHDDSWEKLEGYPDIAETDAFRVLVTRGSLFEVIVPIALPVTWEGDAFVYKGMWPVRNSRGNK